MNLALRIVGRPMTPREMSRLIYIASQGRIWIDPILKFQDLFAYDQIKRYDKPAIRLCSSRGELHWTLAYTTYQMGTWAWRNYYFRQTDNGSMYDCEYLSAREYQRVNWWNLWLMVWD